MERTENSAFGMKDKIGYMFGEFQEMILPFFLPVCF